MVCSNFGFYIISRDFSFHTTKKFNISVLNIAGDGAPETWLLMAICMLFSLLAPSDADPEGFVSIDCGLESNTQYVDSCTGLTYVSDDHYTDAGENHIVANNYSTEYYQFTSLSTLRSFPNNTRNCYTIPSVKGLKYLVRAAFYYGNYDGLARNRSFDLYYGVNFWNTIQITLQAGYLPHEIIAIAPTNYSQVCLVNTGKGTPFISVLELRPLNNTLYTLVYSKQYLCLGTYRTNFGATTNSLIRYPQDPHDRLWFGYLGSDLKGISTNTSIHSDFLDVPSSVLQTAAYSATSNNSFNVIYNQPVVIQNFHIGFHFAEVQTLINNTFRNFYVYINGKQYDRVSLMNSFQHYYYAYHHETTNFLEISLVSTPGTGNLPPILNAYELYLVLPVVIWSPTDNVDGNVGNLEWKQRLELHMNQLKPLFEFILGLEYLHKMCHPPLIHRDVKTTNILLTSNLEAKISDFGLVRAFTGTHVSTQVVGTPGYLDLNYASSSQLTEKSDVYSFGVVLLEIITGRSPIPEDSQMDQHLTQFVQQRISKGYIESVIDPKIEGQYNINSIWKVADLALRCTAEPAKRPDMTAIVTELKDSLELEISSTEPSDATSSATGQSTEHSRNDNLNTVGAVHDFDAEIAKHIGGMLINDSGPSSR